VVSFKDLTDHPILADLAALVDDRAAQGRRAAPETVASTLSSND
jgi:hypothetical protein